ncbi:MAG: NAD kinase [Sphingobacteriaceae bacterium]
MKIAIYGRRFNAQVVPFLQHLFDVLLQKGIEVVVYDKFHEFIQDKVCLPATPQIFSAGDDLSDKVDLMFSLGGDGTLLDTVTLIRDSNIPVLGINFGRLGFLASINKDAIDEAIESLVQKQYTLDKRSLLSIESAFNPFGADNFALNDITFHKRDTSAMIIIHAYLNNEFLNSYWADGLIVATPTGSTAYSLSCGGPIVLPSSGNIVVTPIAPHNLNVRPLVVSDTSELSFEIEGRSSKYRLSCDSRTEVVDTSVKTVVKKAPFEINLIRLHQENYLETLRNKLLWGIDTRNY